MNVCVGTVAVSSLSLGEKPPLTSQKACVGKLSRLNLLMREIAREPCAEQLKMCDGVNGGAPCVGGSVVWGKWEEKSLFRAQQRCAANAKGG